MSGGVQSTVKGHSEELPLTKLFWDRGNDTEPSVQITLTSNHGGQNLGILNRIFDIARQDFPQAELDLDSVNAVVLGGDRRKGMWGIEFRVPKGTKKPDDYGTTGSELILAGGR